MGLQIGTVLENNWIPQAAALGSILAGAIKIIPARRNPRVSSLLGPIPNSLHQPVGKAREQPAHQWNHLAAKAHRQLAPRGLTSKEDRLCDEVRGVDRRRNLDASPEIVAGMLGKGRVGGARLDVGDGDSRP